MGALKVRVVTPDRLIFDGVATGVLAKGVLGQFKILPRHLPMVSLLGVGELRIDVDMADGARYIAIDEGVLEVSNDVVTILANDALAAEDIDIARLQMELERQERKKQNIKSREEQVRQEVEINKLMNQIRVGQRRK